MSGFWIEEGGRCPNCIDGTMQFGPVEGCSCHISPPCHTCVSQPLKCDNCGWEQAEERPKAERVVNLAQPYSVPEDPYRMPIDPKGVKWRNLSHSHCSMLKVGTYPGDMTPTEVEKAIGRGTFGGRFDRFKDNRFVYVAYTD